MFACIYFLEDASLSVVGQLDKLLEVQGSFVPRTKVTMKWGKKTYNGIIIKTDKCQETLVKFANKADSNILKKLGEKLPETVPEDLFSYQHEKKLAQKRPRKPTTKLKESEAQNEELSPTKKRSTSAKDVDSKLCSPKKVTEPPSTDMQLPPPKKTAVSEKTAQATGELMAMSQMLSQFNQPERQDEPSEQPGSYLNDLTNDDQDTSLLSTWRLCNTLQDSNNQETYNFQEVDEGPQQTPTKMATVSKLPVPPPEVVQFIKSILKPEVQEFCRLFVEHFEGSNKCKHEGVECYQSVHSKDTGSDPGTSFSPYQFPMFSATAVPSTQQMTPLPISQPSYDNSGLQYTPSVSQLSSTYQRPVPTSTVSIYYEQDEASTTSYSPNVMSSECFSSPASSTKMTESGASFLRRSPRKQIQFNELQSQSTSKDSDDQQLEPLLKDFPSVLITPNALRSALVKTRKSSRPGYTLCYNLLKCVFTVEELASSRGQGIVKPKPGDNRLPLDQNRINAIKDYSYRWCKKNEKTPASLRDLNTAITEQISHCRKQLRKDKK